MGCRIDVVLEGMKTTLISLHIFIRAIAWPVHRQWWFEIYPFLVSSRSQCIHAQAQVFWSCLTLCEPVEKAMAPHSSTLAWRIPWMGEPGRLQSMGSLRVGGNWATSLSLSTFTQWRRKWPPTPVFLPGESQWWQSLVGCRLWGLTESDTTDVT